MASAQVCPVVGTTNTVLPPTHPKLEDLSGKKCPVTNASFEHHENLSSHDDVKIPAGTKATNAAACPALKAEVNTPAAQKLDEKLCPVVGTATTVLPPDHPDMSKAEPGKVCPKTLATVAHHKDKVVVHPPVSSQGAASQAQCPVVGAKA